MSNEELSVLIHCPACGMLLPELDLLVHRSNSCAASNGQQATNNATHLDMTLPSWNETTHPTETNNTPFHEETERDIDRKMAARLVSRDLGRQTPGAVDDEDVKLSTPLHSPVVDTEGDAANSIDLVPHAENLIDLVSPQHTASSNTAAAAAPANYERSPDVIDLASDEDDTLEEQWACSQCTLLNAETLQFCVVCACPRHWQISRRTRNASAAYSRSTNTNSPSYSSSLHAQSNSPSRMYLGGGALVGGLLGAAISHARGRPMASGVLEGAMSGALGGAVLTEMLQNTPDFEQNPPFPTHQPRRQRFHSSASTPFETCAPQNYARAASYRPRREDAPNEWEESYNQMYSQIISIMDNSSQPNGTVPAAATGQTRNYEQYDQGTRRRRARAGVRTAPPSQIARNGSSRNRSSRRGTRNRYPANDSQELRAFLNQSLQQPNVDAMSYDELLELFGDGSENRAASATSISSLPTISFDNASAGVSQCSICLMNFETGEKLKLLPCTHKCFHEDCIDEWLRRNRSCPICKCSI